MILNPFRRIRELERELELAVLGRVKAEDETRLAHAQLVTAREAESEARRDCAEKSNRIEDWMASLLRQQPIHAGVRTVQPVPPPTKRPVSHGASMESEMISQYEKDLGIAEPN